MRVLVLAATVALPMMLATTGSAQSGGNAPGPGGHEIAVPEMLPGSYTETITTVSVSGDAPPELKAAMRSKASSSSQFCYMPDQTAERRPSIFEVHSGKDCRLVSGTRSGAAATVGLACADSQTKGSITFDGNFQSSAAQFSGTVEVEFVQQKRKMAFTTQVTWQRTGDTCPEAAGG